MVSSGVGSDAIFQAVAAILFLYQLRRARSHGSSWESTS